MRTTLTLEDDIAPALRIGLGNSTGRLSKWSTMPCGGACRPRLVRIFPHIGSFRTAAVLPLDRSSQAEPAKREPLDRRASDASRGMIAPDIDPPLRAHDVATSLHGPARRWWEGHVNGTERVGVTWIVAAGFEADDPPKSAQQADRSRASRRPRTEVVSLLACCATEPWRRPPDSAAGAGANPATGLPRNRMPGRTSLKRPGPWPLHGSALAKPPAVATESSGR